MQAISRHQGWHQRVAGGAALYLGAAYVAAMLYFLVAVGYPDVTDAGDKVDLLVDNQLGIHGMQLVSYVVFGVVLVVLVLALLERLGARATATVRAATAVGLIWAGTLVASGMVFVVGMGVVVDLAAEQPEAAAATWQAIEPVAQGLGGAGGELLGGSWVLLVSVAALRVGGLSRGLCWLGVAVGVAGLASALPGLAVGAIAFGLLQLVWFVALGVTLLRDPTPAAGPSTPVSSASVA